MTTLAQRIQLENYPDHECPEILERNGDTRVGYHAQNSGWLFSPTLIGTDCGCSISGNGTLQHPLLIEPCPLHAHTMYPKYFPEEVPYEVLG